MILIDAHGNDHGLKVELNNRTLTICNWAQLCEPDEDDDWCPRLEHFTCSLADALEASTEEGITHPSMTSRVIGGALRAMFHSGPNDTEWLRESEEPADYFAEDLQETIRAQVTAVPA